MFLVLTWLLEVLLDLCKISVFNGLYILIVYLVLFLGVASSGWYSYIGFKNLEAGFEGHKEIFEEVLMHELFLIMRFFSLGFSILLLLTVFNFSTFLLSQKIGVSRKRVEIAGDQSGNTLQLARR